MSAVSRQQVTMTANGSSTVDLGPYDRLGGRGGAFQIKATTNGTAGGVLMDVLVASDSIARDVVVPAEAATGIGPNRESAVLATGVGHPGDKLTITLKETGGLTPVVTVETQINNR